MNINEADLMQRNCSVSPALLFVAWKVLTQVLAVALLILELAVLILVLSSTSKEVPVPIQVLYQCTSSPNVYCAKYMLVICIRLSAAVFTFIIQKQIIYLMKGLCVSWLDTIVCTRNNQILFARRQLI